MILDMDTKTFKTLFRSALSSQGFTGKGGTWHRDSAETILVINLQTSQFATQFYVNIAWWLKVLGTDTRPKEMDCHIRIRLTELLFNERQLIEQLFNLEDASISNVHRSRRINLLVFDRIVPHILSLQTVQSLKLAFEEDMFKNAAVTLEARKNLAN